MILRHKDVRAAAKDWKTYSSDAPFRVPIPSEEEFRRMRQLPIEVDPPEHTTYRKIVEPFFKKAKDPGMIAQVESLFDELLSAAFDSEATEVVNQVSLPAQSRALTYLLGVPESEAETYISWGMHVFGDKNPEHRAGDALENYLQQQFDRVEANPGDDFFSALTKASYEDRPLTRDEMMGFANLTFAGGRDTVIHSISGVIAHLAETPDALDFLREDPTRIPLASEEYFRYLSPITHIGRVCPVETDVHGHNVPANGRVSLGWASANHDDTVFNKPHEIQLDRKPNPHIAFGAGTHICLGAPHARLILRTLIQKLVDRVKRVTLVDSIPLHEQEGTYTRTNGFETLTVRFEAL